MSRLDFIGFWVALQGEAGEITSEDDHHAALPLPPPPPTIPKESPASLVGSGAGRETAHAALRTETNGHGATSVSPESEEHIEDGPVDELDVSPGSTAGLWSERSRLDI